MRVHQALTIISLIVLTGYVFNLWFRERQQLRQEHKQGRKTK